jgi:hypothetical protein
MSSICNRSISKYSKRVEFRQNYFAKSLMLQVLFLKRFQLLLLTRELLLEGYLASSCGAFGRKSLLQRQSKCRK